MTHFSAYSVGQLKDFLTIIDGFDGNDIADIRSAINAEISDRVKPMECIAAAAKLIGQACPSLGCGGSLEMWPGSSAQAGCLVVGCKLCMYSTTGDK